MNTHASTATIGSATMPYVNGKRFFCSCDCGVFTLLDGHIYECNACRAQYQGTPANGSKEHV